MLPGRDKITAASKLISSWQKLPTSFIASSFVVLSLQLLLPLTKEHWGVMDVGLLWVGTGTGTGAGGVEVGGVQCRRARWFAWF